MKTILLITNIVDKCFIGYQLNNKKTYLEKETESIVDKIYNDSLTQYLDNDFNNDIELDDFISILRNRIRARLKEMYGDKIKEKNNTHNYEKDYEQIKNIEEVTYED